MSVKFIYLIGKLFDHFIEEYIFVYLLIFFLNFDHFNIIFDDQMIRLLDKMVNIAIYR